MTYIPRPVTQRQLFRGWADGLFADVHGHLWFWGVVLAAAVYLSYNFVRWAMTVDGAMRIS